MSEMKNPWLGLLSYQDPSKTSDAYLFCGRDSATNSLFAMIDNNLLVTLYGKTGIGKTSVLNAGVFPLLRSRSYLPVPVRLGSYNVDEHLSYARCLVKAIEEEVLLFGGAIKTSYPDFALSGCSSIEYLWKYFATTVFQNKNGDEIYPVITLDQMEEIFIAHPSEVSILLKQVYALMDDNREIPDLDGYSDSTNFRFVFSIREDDLFYLEDCIDIHHLAEMKQNRYRLTSLTDDEARDVVLLGKQYLEHGAEEEIVSRIIRLAKDESGRISTNILSLLCSQLFIQHHGHITLDQLTDSSQKPLEVFYQDCITRISDSTRQFIETELIDHERRRFVPKQLFLDSIPENDIQTLTSGTFKIIQDINAGNRECVELIHDSLAKTIFHVKAEAEERIKNLKLEKKNKWIKRAIYLLSGVLAASLVTTLTLWINNKHSTNPRFDSLKVSIYFNEDSLIRTDHESWVAQLTTIAHNPNTDDTVYLNKTVDNNFYKDSTLFCQLDSARSIRFILTFNRSLKYRDIDTTISTTELLYSPAVKLPVHKPLPRLTTYAGIVQSNLDGHMVPIQEAIVVLKEKIQRTDFDGEFAFSIEEISDDETIYIIKKGYQSFAERIPFNAGNKRYLAFSLTPVDSLASFYKKCKEVSDLRRNNKKHWTYYCDEKVFFDKDSVSTRIHLYAKKTGNRTVVEGNPRSQIQGYYYFGREFQQTDSLSYRFFSGWIDSSTKTDLQSYEIESYDFAYNRQIMSGTYNRRLGLFEGDISDVRGVIARFGEIAPKP